jgi:hypothetical protein
MVESIIGSFQIKQNLSYLVCGGGGKFSDEEKRLIQELGIEGKVIQTNFKDSELPVFLQKSQSFYISFFI